MISGDALTKGTDYTVAYSNNTDVGTATVTVSPVSTSNYTFTTQNQNFNITHEISSITVTGVTAPVKGAAPVSSAALSETGITAESIKWYVGETGTTELSGNFAASTVYRAEITYTLSSGYSVAPSANATASGGNATVDPANSKIVIVFPATAAKNTQTITASDVTAAYGDTGKSVSASVLGGAAVTYSVTSGGDVIGVDASGNLTIKKVGSAVVTVTAAETEDYAAATKDVTVTVNPKAITVTVDAVSRAYGAANPTFTGTVTGGALVGSDTIASLGITYSTTAGTTSSVGTYDVTGAGTNPNYTITVVGTGKLTVAPADYTYTVSGTQNIKVGSGLSAITVATSETKGVGVNGEPVDGTLAWYSDSGRTTPAQDTDISGKVLGDTVTLYWSFTTTNSNYTSTAKTGSTVFTIVAGDPQTLTFTVPGSVSKVYGDPAFTNAAANNRTDGGMITYESSNTSVATVDANGTVTILKHGTVTITAKAAAVAGKYAEGEQTYTLTITPKTLTVSAGTYKVSKTYDGTTAAGTATGSLAVDGRLAGDSGVSVLAGTIPAYTNTNVHTGALDLPISISGDTDGNYTLGSVSTISVPCEITKATLTVSGIAVADKTYDGTTNATLNTTGVLLSTIYGSDVVSLDVSGVTAQFASADAGATVAVTVTGNFALAGAAKDNYTLTQPTLTGLTGKITPCTTVTDTTSTPQTVVKGVGTFTAPTFTGVNGEEATGTVTYTYSGSPKTFSEIVTALAGLSAGATATITYSFTGSGNYDGATGGGSITVTIVDVAFTVSGGAPATAGNAVTIKSNPTYGDTWEDIVTIGSITAKVGTNGDNGTGTYTLDVTGNPAAGTQSYQVLYSGTINGKTYTNVTVFSGSVTVNAKPITITGVQATTRDYAPSDTTVTLTGGALVGVVGADAVSFTLGTGTMADANAGTGKAVTTSIALTGSAAGNYTLTQPTGVTVTINKIVPTGYTAPSGITATFGQTLSAAVIGTVGTGAGTWAWETPASKVGNVGSNSHNMVFTPTDSTNYNTATESVSVTVSQAAAPALADRNVSRRYNETGALTLSLAGLMPADAGTLSYTAGAKTDADSIIDSWSVAADGTLTYTLTSGMDAAKAGKSAALPVTIGSVNYGDSTVKVIVTLTNKETQAALTITSGTTVTYGETLTLSTSGGSGTGAVTYTVTNGTGAATVSGSTLTPTQAGTVTVTATKAADGTYTEITSAPVTITINKATPTGVPKYTAITTGGKTLADAALTTAGGTFSVPGMVAWELADTTTVQANTAYKWIFTPDSGNYESISGEITLWDYTPPVAPSRPSSSTGSTTLPVTTDDKREDGAVTTETTAVPDATVKDDTAFASISNAVGKEIIRQAAENESSEVVIVPDITEDVSRTEVTIPAATLDGISERTDADLRIETPVSSVTIPNGGLSALAESGGRVTVAAEKVGSSVELTITADGETVESIPGGVTLTVPCDDCTPGTVAVLVRDDGTREVVRKSVADSDGQTITIPLDGSAKLEIVDNSGSFCDVLPTDWHKAATDFVSAHELFGGTGPDTFSPNGSMTRGMVFTVLARLENVDTSGGTTWYEKGMEWSVRNGISDGTNPNADVTREQLVTMLWRSCGSPAASGSLRGYVDGDQASEYAREALSWAVANGILGGRGGGILDPRGTASRAEVAQMIKNFMENVG